MLTGTGFYIHQIPQCEGGNVAQIAAEAAAAGLSHVLIKIADGVGNYNLISGLDLAAELVEALHGRGIAAWGWHYVYGFNPKDEAARAARRIQETGVDGFVVNAEKEYKLPGRAQAASTYVGALRAGFRGPLALSSYRYPSLHREFPWNEFLSRVDLNMPQVYWEQAHNPGYQLARSVREFEAMGYVRPILPTGAAYKANGWAPTVADVGEFMQTARELGLTGYNFWDWQHCRRDHPDLWALIAGPQAEPEPAPVERLQLTYFPWRNCRTGPGTSYPTHAPVMRYKAVFDIVQRLGDWGRMDDGRWIFVANGVRAV